MHKWFALILFSALILPGCSSGKPRVHIRIHNEGPQDISAFWLGAGGPNGKTLAFGAIANGQTTPYRAVAPMLANYRKSNYITGDGRRHLDVIYPEQHFDQPVLVPGHYTFVYLQQNGQSRIKLLRDPE